MLTLGWMNPDIAEKVVDLLRLNGYYLYSIETNHKGEKRVQMATESHLQSNDDILIRLFESFNPKNHA